MAVPHPFGVALSGGGFRATAFHLGVLKRLRELGLLEKVDVLSTVSGGSIAGAYWVYWQATKGDTIGKSSEWNQFESSLIKVMHRGLRGWVWWRGFGVPASVLGILACVVAWYRWPLSIGRWLALVSMVLILAYVSWHYRASRLLEKRYDSTLFKGGKMLDLGQFEQEGRDWPRLVINATSLNAGEHLLFTHYVREGKPASAMIDSLALGSKVSSTEGGSPREEQPRSSFRTKVLFRGRRPIPMDADVPVARAVTASSAFPGVFTPLTIVGPLAKIRLLLSRFQALGARYRVVDGGVFDNQGTQVLLDVKCRGIAVSDAAAALTPTLRPSTWQVFPPGHGVLFRSQGIVYERVRDLGYERLTARHDLFRLVEQAIRLGFDQQDADQLMKNFEPPVEGYAYVELRPSRRFRYDPQAPRLPEAAVPYVAGIRTDLDRFSSIEISALMFHGYTLIDHCLRAYRHEWVTQFPDAQFQSATQEVNIDWAAIRDEELAGHIRHLAASDSRVFMWRVLRRLYHRLVSDSEWLRVTEGTP